MTINLENSSWNVRVETPPYGGDVLEADISQYEIISTEHNTSCSVPICKPSRLDPTAESELVPWGNTCNACRETGFTWTSDKALMPDLENSWNFSWRSKEGELQVMQFPQRCRACETKHKRWIRMVRRVERVGRLSRQRKWRPKLITFAYLSSWTTDPNPESEMIKFKKQFKKAKQILKKYRVRGGYTAFEYKTRTRCRWDMSKKMEYYHHPHVHMAAVAPFIDQEDLAKIDSELREINLGRIDIKSSDPSETWGYTEEEREKHLANYLAKYMIKQATRCDPWGICTRNGGGAG